MNHPLCPERRHLLKLVAAVAAAGSLPQGGHAQQAWQFDPFSLGVASGSPESGSVVLWTRLLAPSRFDPLEGAAIPVRWEVADDEAFKRIVRNGEASARAELAHSVHVEVAGLQPDRWYHYRFMAGQAVSAVGRTRTLPAPGAMVSRLRLSYASCQRWEHGHYGAWRHMLDEQLDLVMFLGDYIYEYPNATAAIRSFPTLGWVQTLAEYRERHALHRSDPHLQAMHAACPWLMTWDDHEVQNDYAGRQPGDGFPFGMNAATDFPARRAAAHQAYYEHMPLRASEFARSLAGAGTGAGTGVGELRLHTRYRYGQLADLLLLDTRQYRDPQSCGPRGRPAGMVRPATCAAWNDPGRSLLGAAQERWLEGSLAQAGGGWTVIGQQTLFGQRDNLAGAGQAFWNDGWDGYRAARSRVTDSLQRNAVANPILLGGDVHENWVGHVKADYDRPDSPAIGVEFCGTSITSRPKAPERLPGRLAENPHYVFADAAHRGYGVVEFQPGQLTTALRVLDDATRPDAQVSTLARFRVEAGRAQVQRA